MTGAMEVAATAQPDSPGIVRSSDRLSIAPARTPSRPLLRYHGGKWKLARWILQHLPQHKGYVEPFGGGGSILLCKARSYSEVYNDLDGEIVNLFRVVRERGDELAQSCEDTPYARTEFDGSYEPSGDAFEQARRTLVRAWMGFGTAGVSRASTTGFRCCSRATGTHPAQDWMRYPEVLRAVRERLRGVVIENRDAIEVMAQQDGPDVLHYVDPPYVHGTRFTRKAATTYRHEMTDDQHRDLARALAGLRGMVVVSGYRCELYDELFAGWQRIDAAAHADGARDRVESLWLSPRCPQAGLFAMDNVQMSGG